MIPKRKSNDQSNDDGGNDIAEGVVLDSAEIILGTKMSEADYLSRGGDYAGAIPFYSQAISIKPSEALYLRRSRCYAFIGEMKAALEDSKSAYALNPKSIKAILCQADNFYGLGDFESALLWYSRGLNLKPDNNDCKSGKYYRLISGVNRCQEAIIIALNEFQDHNMSKIKERIAARKENGNAKTGLQAYKTVSLSSLSPETIEKNLLEELYPDRLFLKECMDDRILMDNHDVAELIRQGNTFFEQRLEFYRSRNPFATTPLLTTEEPSTDQVRNSSPTFRRRASSSNRGRAETGAIQRIVTQIGDMFTSNRSPEATSTPEDVDNIYSYLGESIIVTFLSFCCFVTFPIALLAIYNAAQVDALVLRGKQRAAMGYARTARILLIVSASGTVILYAAAFLLFLQLMQPI